MAKESVLVVFGSEMPPGLMAGQYDAVIAGKELEALVGPGSIYEATALLEELSRVHYADGTRVSKTFVYKGYELWWIHYDNLFRYFCQPYIQYKQLLERLREYTTVHLYRPPYKSLFACYIEAHGGVMTILPEPGLRAPAFLPFGVLLQMLLTLVSLPFLAVLRRPVLVYTGDKFEKDQDFDFRMRYIYEELRRRNQPFVEFIRGLESWSTILSHAWTRRRPVVYSEAVVFVARFLGVVSGARANARRRFGPHIATGEADPERRFKLLLSTQYLLTVDEDVWAIRLMRIVLKITGVRAAIVPGASQRSFHTVIAAKLLGIPTVGILHGVASRFYNVYDFMHGFDGDKRISLDAYGLWSEWWLTYFKTYSRAYKPEELFVSGPMRPLAQGVAPAPTEPAGGPLRVLFVSEEMAVPQEVLPYLRTLLRQQDMEVTLKFRPYRDGFEQWLLRHEPGLLAEPGLRIVKGSMQEAFVNADVAVGCQSTGVLESLLSLKVPLYFQTQKWGDYYDLGGYGEGAPFFAHNPEELVEKLHRVRQAPPQALKHLQERYFGDPYKNGSAWVVERALEALTK